MDQLYGYRQPFPVQSSGDQYDDDCLTWTRDAIQWLIRFSRLEQSAVVPVSLRTMLGKKAWSAGLKTGSWSVNLNLKDFQGMKHVRLRGISVFADDDDDRIWNIDVKIPHSSEALLFVG